MYSPKIKDKLVMEMYQIKLKTGKKITQQANEAIIEYLNKFNQKTEVLDGDVSR